MQRATVAASLLGVLATGCGTQGKLDDGQPGSEVKVGGIARSTQDHELLCAVGGQPDMATAEQILQETPYGCDPEGTGIDWVAEVSTADPDRRCAVAYNVVGEGGEERVLVGYGASYEDARRDAAETVLLRAPGTSSEVCADSSAAD